MGQSSSSSSQQNKLSAMTGSIDLSQFMTKWYVMANIPTFVEIDTRNCIETYTWNEKTKRIGVFFEYTTKYGEYSTMRQYGTIKNSPVDTHWGVNPQVCCVYLPLDLDYLIIDCAEDYSYSMVGVPDRSYLWIMTKLKPRQIKAKTAEAYLSSVSTPESISTEGVTVMVDGKEEMELTEEAQNTIMRKCFDKSKELGYDTSKILMVGWTK